MTDDSLIIAQQLKQRRDYAIAGSNRANQASDSLEKNSTQGARDNLVLVIQNNLTREQIEVFCDLAVAFTAKNLKAAERAYEQA